ncbi:MAG TPA: hypothetical protein VKB75_00305 [Jatrophihabitans sp.]|nr:hypothetical protein [Jatrophihabitans sp.]
MAPRPSRRPPDDPGRPTPREAIAKVRAEAGPRVAKAMDSAAPKVEKAAGRAGKLLGTLRERAKDTAKQFSEGYAGEDDGDPKDGEGGSEQPRPRPRPKPGPR